MGLNGVLRPLRGMLILGPLEGTHRVYRVYRVYSGHSKIPGLRAHTSGPWFQP